MSGYCISSVTYELVKVPLIRERRNQIRPETEESGGCERPTVSSTTTCSLRDGVAQDYPISVNPNPLELTAVSRAIECKSRPGSALITECVQLDRRDMSNEVSSTPNTMSPHTSSGYLLAVCYSKALHREICTVPTGFQHFPVFRQFPGGAM
jgi:hypothetical protein